MRRYSRLLTVEERKHRRRAALYTLLTIALFVILIFFGLPTVALLGAFISDLRNSTSQESKNDTIPPTIPRFSTSEIATNSATLIISGTSEAQSEVTLFRNGGELRKVDADESALFQMEVTLFEGENTFVARAKDEAGNESQNSESLSITLDTMPPEITITEPQTTEFSGKSQETVTILGSVNEEAQISVNDRLVTQDAENNFSTQIKLSPGENKFIIKTVDTAGNSAEEELNLTFSL